MADHAVSDAATGSGPETPAEAGYRLSPQQAAVLGRGVDAVPRLTLLLRLGRPVDAEALAQRWQQRVADLEILRIVCRTPAWSRLPLQFVMADARPGFTVKDIDAAAVPQLTVLGITVDAATPPVEVRLLRDGGHGWLVLSGGAHALDGDSMLALAADLLEAPGAVDADALPYLDVAEWSGQLTDDPEAQPGLSWWRRTGDALTSAPLPLGTTASVAPSQRLACSVPWPAAWNEAAPTAVEATAVTLVFAARLADADSAAVALRSNGRDLDELADVIGPLARWLPVVGTTPLEAPFDDWRAAAATAVRAAHEWQHLAEAGLDAAMARRVAVGVELCAPEPAMPATVERRDPEPGAPPLLLRIDPAARTVTLLADRQVADGPEARRLLRLFVGLAEAAATSSSVPVDALDWLDPTSAAELLAMGTGPELTGADDVVLDRVATVATTQAEAPAVVYDDQPTSYGELWRQAGAVAASLPAGSTGDERPVAVHLGRGTAALAAMLGAWRAGRPYLPCDPALPAARIAEMMRVAAAAAEVGAIPDIGDAPDLSTPGGQRLAYLLFTSGSTGTPKAIAVTHGGLAASTAARSQHYGRDPARFLVVSPLGFDSSAAGLYWCLATGGCVTLPTDAQARDAAALIDLIRDQSITHTLMLPALYQAVLEAAAPGDLDSLELVIVAGEACAPDLVARHRAQLPSVRLENEYGPTEATVWCTAARLDTDPDGIVSIGGAIPGARVRLLDRHLRPVPPGVPGEICIAGPGLARGYLGRPAETAARFVPDPASPEPGGRLYRSGDRGALLHDGRILYQGRIDNQVKLRGYRVELEEIDAALQAEPGVQAAATAVRDGRLVGYLVLRDPPDGEDDAIEALAQRLAGRLPDWMVPQTWVRLAALPQGATGKLDRGALPAPEAAGPGVDTRPPRDETETAVAAIWAELLDIPTPGIDEDFFRLGGDSLLALRAATRMRQIGVEASARLLLQHPTIADILEAAPRRAANSATKTAVAPTEPVPLLPIQHWLVDRAQGLPARYNQALRAVAREPLDLARLERAFAAVVQRHDALRLRFTATAGGWRQVPGAALVEPPRLYDIAAVPQAAHAGVETAAWEALHGGLDPASGRLAMLAVLRRGTPTGDLLLIAIHHLAMDAVSWRVLMADLEHAYRGLQAGEPPAWTAPAGSFAAWAEAVGRLPHDPGAVAYWRAQAAAAADCPPLPRDRAQGANSEGDIRVLRVSLESAATERLAGGAPAAFGAGLDDLLAATLAESLAAWQGASRVRIDRERHGRNDELVGLDSEHTVGWFTTIHPLVLDVPDGPARDRLAAVLAQVAAVPDDGFGYGLLRWLGTPETALPAHPEGEVLFNYLGRTDRLTPPDALFAFEAGSEGRGRAPELPRRCLLEIDGEIAEGRLAFDWRYPATLYDEATIASLARDHLARVADLAAQVAAP